jgi:hypothetical protein
MFPKKSVDFQWAAQHYIPGNITLHNHHCGNFKLYKDPLFCLCNADGIVKSFVSCPCVNLCLSVFHNRFIFMVCYMHKTQC